MKTNDPKNLPKSIAIPGQGLSHAKLAAKRFAPDADLKVCPLVHDLITAVLQRQTELAIIPIYNTREGEIKEYSRVMERLDKVFWVDNIILPVNLSLGALGKQDELQMLIGSGSDLRQCDEYIAEKLPGIDLMIVQDIDQAIATLKANHSTRHGVIGSESLLAANGLTILERELAPHNQTRFAVLSREPATPTGYDATAMLTTPLTDRVGLLFDILGEFTRRGVSLLDLRSENDIKTQKLQIYIEAEGHIDDEPLRQAIKSIEGQIIQEDGGIKVLGSFPRVDMRPKRIRNFGFIGTGAMSRWFADKLKNEGYNSILSGRTTDTTPEEMIPNVDVVMICVPISATSATIAKYGPLLRDGQALILLAGEAENNLNTALTHTSHGVEVMLIHNLWGPQAANMKDKNAAVVRTARSGSLCSEFESFLYKHGANIIQDAPSQHDLLMGVGQKLPTTISVALAMTLKENGVPYNDIGSHSTLTSLYGILALARVHTQNPRTYAEIMATMGESRKIVRSFAKNLIQIMDIAEAGGIDSLCEIIEQNRAYLTPDFLEARMRQALAVDDTLGKMIRS